MAYPPELERLHRALASLPGVFDVCSGIESLQGLTYGDDLRFPDFAHLPHGAPAHQRRAGGEALVQVEFRIAPSAVGWHRWS